MLDCCDDEEDYDDGDHDDGEDYDDSADDDDVVTDQDDQEGRDDIWQKRVIACASLCKIMLGIAII